MLKMTYRPKLAISLPATVSHSNLMFLTKLKPMVNVNIQLVKMEPMMITFALSMQTLLVKIRFHMAMKRKVSM